MFERELDTITLSGKEYPIKCSILVLEKIQDKYETLEAFEDDLSIFEDTKENEEIKVRFPKMTALCDALYWMVQEGEEITAEEEGRKPIKYKRESLVRKMDGSLFTTAQILKREFGRSFVSKNQKTTKTENTETNQ